jgi:hypothetical protein
MLDVNFSLMRTGEPFILKNHKIRLLLFPAFRLPPFAKTQKLDRSLHIIIAFLYIDYLKLREAEHLFHKWISHSSLFGFSVGFFCAFFCLGLPFL